MAKKIIFWAITLSFSDLEKFFIQINPPKWQKLQGSFKRNFSLKLIFNHFLATTKYIKMGKLCKFDNVRKWLNINFREKFYLKDPYIFASFGGLICIKIFSRSKIDGVMAQFFFLPYFFIHQIKNFQNQEYNISLWVE